MSDREIFESIDSKDALAEYAQTLGLDLNLRLPFDELKVQIRKQIDGIEAPEKAEPNEAPEAPKSLFLKNPKTGFIFPRTPLLEQFGGLVPCDEPPPGYVWPPDQAPKPEEEKPAEAEEEKPVAVKRTAKKAR